MHRTLNASQHFANAIYQSILRYKRFAFFAWHIASSQRDGSVCHVLWTDFESQWYAAHFPIVKFEARCQPVALIHLYTQVCPYQIRANLLRGLHYASLLLIVFEYWNDHD